MDNPDQRPSVPGLLRKAKAMVAAGRLGPAFQLASGIVKDAPSDARGYLLAAEILEENLRFRAALDFAARGLTVAPGHKELSLMQAKLLRLAGNTAASIAAYESLVEIYPWSESLKIELGLALIANGDATRALPLVEGILEPEGKDATRAALRTLVLARVYCGDLSGARQAYERIHRDTHAQLLSEIHDEEIASQLGAGETAGAGFLLNCGAALARLATQASSPPLRSFLNAAGDLAGLGANRSYYFPYGRSSPSPAARLDAVLASSRATQAGRFVDPESPMVGLTYRTANLGDDVQTLAVVNLVGKVKGFVDRDQLDEPGPRGKVVLNGWWGHDRSFPIATRDLSIGWPPRADLDPLVISFHLDPLRAALYLTNEGIAFLKEHEPIGCRDRWTERLLQRCGIKAYFSGCLTLTLPAYEGKRADRILLVDLPERALPYVSRAIGQHCKIRQKVITHDMIRFTLDPARRLNAADFLLQYYARSRFVVTTRLHVALPCLAMGTPVLFLPRDAADHRFDGLAELLNIVPFADAMEDSTLFAPDRWAARTEHLGIRKSLINAVRDFAAR